MFRLDAFTNKVGDLYEPLIRTVISDGMKGDRFTGWTPYHREDVVVMHGKFSGKPPIRKGNHRDDLPYERTIREVTFESPRKTHYKWINPTDGVTSSYDYMVTDWISADHGPFNYIPYNWEVIENSYAESQVKALNNLNQAKATLWADFAQTRQAVDMFADTASRVARLLLAFKRGQVRNIPEILGWGKRAGRKRKTLADYWLEYQYGWKPLVGSLHDTYEVATAALTNGKFVSGTGKSTFKHAGSFPYGRQTQSYITEGRIKTHLVGKISSSFLNRMSSYGVINPATVAWELVPWSFAVDWFIPVGATLEAMTATVGLDFVRGYQTRHLTYELQIVDKVGSMGQFSNGTRTDPGFYLERGYDFDRDVLTGWPAAEFYADETPFSTPRVLNAIALCRQLLK